MQIIQPYIPECMQYKTTIIMHQCPTCGKTFIRHKSICCSAACALALRKATKSKYNQENAERLREQHRAWKAENREHIDEM